MMSVMAMPNRPLRELLFAASLRADSFDVTLAALAARSCENEGAMGRPRDAVLAAGRPASFPSRVILVVPPPGRTLLGG